MQDITARLARKPLPLVTPVETPGAGGSGLLTLAIAVVVVAALYLGREVMIPITLGVLLSFLLAPLVNLLRRLHLGRVPSVFLAVVLAIGVILALGGLIGMQIAELAPDVPHYERTIEQKVQAVRGVTLGRLNGVMKNFGQQLDRFSGAAQPATAPGRGHAPAAGGHSAPPQPVPVEVHQPDLSPLQLSERIIAPVLSPLSTAAIMFIFTVFILLQREDLRDRLIRLFGSGDLHRTTAAMNEAARRLSKYFLTQLAINAVFGIIIGTGLFFIGVPSPLLWGMLGLLLRFVPYIGSPLSAVLPLVLAAGFAPGWSMLIETAALYVVVEPVMAQVVEPMVYGHSTGLSPFSVILAATFWTWLWGPIGLILSTPITLCLVVLGRYVKRFEFLDVLLGDQPALTPVESFYQRMLAGDADEAQDQAEALLKEYSLSAYYDEVALKGLQLAVNDSVRGVLTPLQLERIKAASRDLIEELDDQEDEDPTAAEKKKVEKESANDPAGGEPERPAEPAPQGMAPAPAELPPEWRSERAVLCIAGRGPLDEATSLMMAQLLRKHALGATALPHEAVARDRINALDVADVAMVCVSYLEISAIPPHLRSLIRRLRRRLPTTPILIGRWPAESRPTLDDLRRDEGIGANYYASSLHDAVEICLDAARRAAEPAQIVTRETRDPPAFLPLVASEGSAAR